MNKFNWWFFIIGAVVLGALIFVGWKTIGREDADDNKDEVVEDFQNTDDKTGIEPSDGWLTYTNKSLGITFQYPKELKRVVNADGSVSVGMWGPTQREGTEGYDGMNVTFRRGAYDQVNLKKFIDDKLSELTEIGQLVGTVKKTTLDGVDGYTYVFEGLGRYTTYLLDVAEGEYLEVVVWAEDPTGLGFDEMVDGILESLEVTV